jgi:hypothetical protein
MKCDLYAYRRDRFICQMNDCGHHEAFEVEMWKHLRLVHQYEVQPELFNANEENVLSNN